MFTKQELQLLIKVLSELNVSGSMLDLIELVHTAEGALEKLKKQLEELPEEPKKEE